MTTEIIAAFIFTFTTSIVILFQLALALGAPWGAASMGGKYPGVYPPKMRAVAVINVLILCFTAMIVLSRAGLFFPGFYSISRIGIWVVVAFFIVGTVLNTITPSKVERIWAPVAGIQLATSVLVALS